MHGKFAAAKVSTFVVSDFCVVWDFDCQRLCITPQLVLFDQKIQRKTRRLKASIVKHDDNRRHCIMNCIHDGMNHNKLCAIPFMLGVDASGSRRTKT